MAALFMAAAPQVGNCLLNYYVEGTILRSTWQLRVSLYYRGALGPALYVAFEWSGWYADVRIPLARRPTAGDHTSDESASEVESVASP